MHVLDWIILVVTLITIICYGIYKSKASKNIDGYFRSNKEMPWYLVTLGIMGTHASAITFISLPGQAINNGMFFLQQYFGLPLAMIVICITFVPIFHKLNLYTAYQFLETRFDKKTRTFASIIFLISRGLSTGITVVAPSIILAGLFHWDIYFTNVIMGGILIIYTVTGGAKAVAYTQQLQFVIIIIGMGLAGYYAVHLMPSGIGFKQAIQLATNVNKTTIISNGLKPNGHFNWNDKFNIYSGIIGGFFLALSYFGTDQSQVGRYLTAKSIKESRIGLLANGLLKIPMQFLIMLVGILVFSFFQFQKAPINFNNKVITEVLASVKKDSANAVINEYEENKVKLKAILATNLNDSIKVVQNKILQNKTDFNNLAKRANLSTETDDTNYIFLNFVKFYLPIGVVGLLIAMIFLTAWGSIAAALNSLASSTLIDIHKQYSSKNLSEKQEFNLSKKYTLLWGLFCIVIAQFATSMGSLIVAVNILGSLFYGNILGIFLAAFYIKYIKADSVFIAAIITQLIIFYIYFVAKFEGYLWLNVIGAILVIFIAVIAQTIKNLIKK